MQRVKFNNCLNKEIKFWNISLGSLIGGGLLGSICWYLQNLLWFFGGGAIGFAIGGYLLHQYYLGNVQRFLYWHLPVSNILLGKKIPASHLRVLM